MRKAICLTAALLFASAAEPTQSETFKGTSKTERAAPIRVSLREPQRTASRSQVAVCANLAAIRAMDAKAVGASYAAQDRILDLTFVLCMSGPQTED
jgi:hypothetical protein